MTPRRPDLINPVPRVKGLMCFSCFPRRPIGGNWQRSTAYRRAGKTVSLIYLKTKKKKNIPAIRTCVIDIIGRRVITILVIEIALRITRAPGLLPPLNIYCLFNDADLHVGCVRTVGFRLKGKRDKWHHLI